MTIDKIKEIYFKDINKYILNTTKYWGKKLITYNIDYEEIVYNAIIKLIDKWSKYDELELFNLYNLEREQYNNNEKYIVNYLYKTINNSILKKLKDLNKHILYKDNTDDQWDENKMNLIEICLLSLIESKEISEEDKTIFLNYFKVNDDLKKLYKRIYYKVKTKVKNKLNKHNKLCHNTK